MSDIWNSAVIHSEVATDYLITEVTLRRKAEPFGHPLNLWHCLSV